MKMIISLILVTAAASFSVASEDCSLTAESYVTNVGNTRPAVLVDINKQGNLVYDVRTNDNGGDAAYEVIVTPRCNLISIRLLWSE